MTKITKDSSLSEVAAIVSQALSDAGIAATLSGGVDERFQDAVAQKEPRSRSIK